MKEDQPSQAKSMEINEHASTSIDCPQSPPVPTDAEDSLRRLGQKSSEKLNAYIQGQLQASIDDYKLLEQMNDVTAQRYKDMKQVAESISGRLGQMQKKYEDLRPFLDQINEIDEASRRMEQAVSTLESYLGALEAKLRKIQLQNG